jgi:hypothetical protein
MKVLNANELAIVAGGQSAALGISASLCLLGLAAVGAQNVTSMALEYASDPEHPIKFTTEMKIVTGVIGVGIVAGLKAVTEVVANSLY